MNRHGRGWGEHQLFFAHLSAAGLIEEGLAEMPYSGPFTLADLARYFPEDAIGNAYLEVMMWNHKLMMRTGKSKVTPNLTYGTSYYDNAALSAAQAQFITSKFNTTIMVGSSGSYPSAMAANQKMFPIGIHTNTSLGNYVYQDPIVAV